MRLEAGWVPVALSASIELGTSAGAVVEGSEIVVWRDNSGSAHVWEDRCPHRGMRLSFGFVRGDHIACLYHGWQYDTAGQCRYIPAHPDLDVPQTIRVPTYEAREAAGLIWATSEAGMPLPSADSSEITPVRSLYVDAPQADVVAAFGQAGLDFAGGNSATATILGVPLLAGMQVCGPDRTAVHIVCLSAVDAATRHQLSKWAEALRDSIEASAAIAKVA